MRTPLLIETLITRRQTRSGPIYLFRRPAGPPAMKDTDLDKWIHRAAQTFDFTPLFNGDQIQAREVAEGYLRHLKKEANRERMNWKVISKRLKASSPHVRRGLMTFFAYYDGRLKTV